jgi:hypothetical protein
MERAFSPLSFVALCTQGVALGWDDVAPLALFFVTLSWRFLS